MFQKIKGIIAPVVVVCVVLMIVIPLPTYMLDFLLILNLALALTILFISMSIKKALEFSILPSLLLLTTLFRLGLEVSATRLILGNGGNAGNVIYAFGHFVIQGNLAVGLVVFLIIVIEQFIVITKGAERVSEVAARFSLDAMPGKQMAIDADLNSGLITEAEAKTRRHDVERESDFFGSMDGASKFVKGDAVVSIIIMIINIVGGIIMGLVAGQDINSVMRTYTLATVGEGLMAQLPALLISTSTGIVVTRTASDNNMSVELSHQLFSQPTVLKTTGVVLLSMIFLPGFPKPILFINGMCFLLLGIQAGKKTKEQQKTEVKSNEQKPNMQSEIEFLRNPDNVYQTLEVETIEMEFGYSLIPLVNESQGGSFIDKVVLFRRQFAQESGVVIPSVRMRDNIQLENNQYVIKIRGEQVAEGKLLVDHLLAMSQDEKGIQIDGIDTIEPAFGLPAKWIEKSKRDDAEIAGYTVIDPASVMMTHLGEVIRGHADEILGRHEVNSMLNVVKKSNKSLVEEIIPNKISVGELQHVLQSLLREKIPVRDMVTILETVSDHAANIKDPDLLAEYVRQSLKRTISHKFAPEGSIKALVMDPQTEKLITANAKHTESGIYIALEPDKAQNILNNIEKQVGRLTQAGLDPLVLTSPGVRLYLRKLTEQAMPDLIILSYGELENNVSVQAVGAIAA